MLFGVSFGTFRRRRRDILMGHCECVSLRRLGDVPLRRRWAFHLWLVWDVVESYRWDVVVTSSWGILTTFQYDVVETYHWDVLAMFHQDVVVGISWGVTVTLLGRTRRQRCDVATTSCYRAGPHHYLLKK